MPNGRIAHRVGRWIKFFAMCLVYGVILLLLLRFCSAEVPSGLKDVSPNEILKDAFRASGEKLDVRYQNQDTITRAENCYGYFSIPEYYYIVEAKQVQLVFRYNDSTLEHLKTDYSLPEPPQKSGDYFDVSLVETRGEESVRISPSAVQKDISSKYYAFYRYTFDGVEITDETDGLFADFYYLEDLDYEKPPYGSLCLYNPADKWFSYDLTSAEKKALRE